MPSLKLQPNPASNFELIYLCDVVKQKYQTLAGSKFRWYEKFSSLGHVSSKWRVIKKCRHDLGQEPPQPGLEACYLTSQNLRVFRPRNGGTSHVLWLFMEISSQNLAGSKCLEEVNYYLSQLLILVMNTWRNDCQRRLREGMNLAGASEIIPHRKFRLTQI